MLKMKLLTFRDKLQPGEKEQWKLQVTNLTMKSNRPKWWQRCMMRRSTT